jgi:hypothetical protein
MVAPMFASGQSADLARQPTARPSQSSPFKGGLFLKLKDIIPGSEEAYRCAAEMLRESIEFELETCRRLLGVQSGKVMQYMMQLIDKEESEEFEEVSPEESEEFESVSLEESDVRDYYVKDDILTPEYCEMRRETEEYFVKNPTAWKGPIRAHRPR